MSEDDLMQIRIKNCPVGIVGLQVVMADMADDYYDQKDEEIGEEMLRRLAPMNYIPNQARSFYIDALVREFRNYLEQPVEEEKYTEGLRMVVLGPGCAQCDRMENDVREVMAEMHLAAALDHVVIAGEEWVGSHRII